MVVLPNVETAVLPNRVMVVSNGDVLSCQNWVVLPIVEA